ncbi:MAG: MFS transporter [Oscillospiraceae bacterium]|jgi:GPH family glycoside/pentoside/hexuronide:cation symporter/probable glucitol transport protein GutA|nr:MFS transporter [Oscillospiraceae bacterium]
MALSESQRRAIRHPLRWLFNPEPEQPGEIPRKELAFYTLGFWGQNHLYNMAGTNWFFHFCTNVLKIHPGTVGKMTGAVTVFDALNDPVAGAIIDNHRFKDGRKLLPWIKWTSPFIALTSFLLFVNWHFSSTGTQIFYSVMVYLCWDMLYSFQDASLWGMTAAISTHSAQRARATQWADNGAFLGGLLPGLLLPMLSGNGAFGLTQQQVYFMFAVVMCLGGGFQSLFALGTTERVRSLPREERTVWSNVGALRHNYILLLFLASEILRACGPNVADAYIYQQMTFQVGGKAISAPLVMTILGTIFGLPGSALKFFATKIADRVGGMKRLLVIGVVTDLLTRVIGYFIGIQTLPRQILVSMLGSISYLPNSIYSIAMRSMLSDSVEYVEWKTGERTEGITMSVRNLMSKMGGAIARFIQGRCLVFLQFSADRVEQGRPQNAHFQKWVWPVYRLGPALGLALGLVPLLLLRYPDALKQKVESEMAQRRELREERAEALES